jgi:hypothetical protein
MLLSRLPVHRRLSGLGGVVADVVGEVLSHRLTHAKRPRKLGSLARPLGRSTNGDHPPAVDGDV